jgi:flavin-dependent dehydrogenase
MIVKDNLMKSEVIIAGSGVAASACALRLAGAGFRPFLLTRDLAMAGGVEAIGEYCWPLIQDLGLWCALEEAGAEVVTGFENCWDASHSEHKPGKWAHVERRAFAAAAVREAVRRGATVLAVRKPTPLRIDHEGASVEIDGQVRRFAAAVDATGRLAAWSRPVVRRGRDVATLFESPRTQQAPGRVIRLPHGWAFSIGVNLAATVGLVGGYSNRMDSRTRARLGLEGDVRLIGRRPAFPQWCQVPVRERRIAVGDAALAYNPIAGHGIHFALASATSAAAVIRAWQTGPDTAAIAERYYCAFVDSARTHHLEFLRTLPNVAAAAHAPAALPAAVRFTGTVRPAELNCDGHILQGEAIEMESGGLVRWLGGFDLLALRTLAPTVTPTRRVEGELGLPPARAARVIRWCVDRGILSAAPEPIA